MKNLFFICLIALLFGGCAKDGDTGPAGPAGEDGNANVQVEIINIYVEDWEYQNDLYQEQTSSDLLNDEIAEYGSVSLFMNAGPGVWLALPAEGFGFAYDNTSLYLYAKLEPTATIVLKLVVIAGMPE